MRHALAAPLQARRPAAAPAAAACLRACLRGAHPRPAWLLARRCGIPSFLNSMPCHSWPGSASTCRRHATAWAHAAAALLLLAALPTAAGSIVTVHNRCDTNAMIGFAVYDEQQPNNFWPSCDAYYDEPAGQVCVHFPPSPNEIVVNTQSDMQLGLYSSADTMWITTLDHPSWPSQYVTSASRTATGFEPCTDASECQTYTWFEVRAAPTQPARPACWLDRRGMR